MPTNRVHAFCNKYTSAKPQNKINKYLSRVEVYFKVDIQDISIGMQYFWLLNEGDAHKVEKWNYKKQLSDQPHLLVLVPQSQIPPRNEKMFHFLPSMDAQSNISSFLFHPYKVEKEKPFNFHDSICDRTPRLAYVGGQEVVLHNFIFPPCVHLLHLGAKNTAHLYSWEIFIYLLLWFSTGAFGCKKHINSVGGHG